MAVGDGISQFFAEKKGYTPERTLRFFVFGTFISVSDSIILYSILGCLFCWSAMFPYWIIVVIGYMGTLLLRSYSLIV